MAHANVGPYQCLGSTPAGVVSFSFVALLLTGSLDVGVNRDISSKYASESRLRIPLSHTYHHPSQASQGQLSLQRVVKTGHVRLYMLLSHQLFAHNDIQVPEVHK